MSFFENMMEQMPRHTPTLFASRHKASATDAIYFLSRGVAGASVIR